MEHFSEQAWADLIRGLRNSESDKIEAHLAGNCAECRRVYDTWDRVHTVMLREKLYSTPEHLARMAKLEFVSRQEFNAAPAVLATLTFDSFTRPAQAGIRSAAAAARQMVYETDGLAVDLRFDHSPTGKLVLVTGQVLDKLESRAPLESVLLILWTAKGLPIAESRANAFGEFYLQFEPENDLRLSIQAVGRQPVSISLANLGPESHSDDLSGQR